LAESTGELLAESTGELVAGKLLLTPGELLLLTPGVQTEPEVERDAELLLATRLTSHSY
jgi:hypothetical protein